MKNRLLLVLAGVVSLSAYAEQTPASPDVFSYDYGMHLDISQVVNMAPIADVCWPTLAQITYKDSHGEVHILGYSVMGTGCSN